MNRLGQHFVHYTVWLILLHIYQPPRIMDSMICCIKRKWEVLPADIQKDIMLSINRNQSGNGLKIGPFGSCINRESFKLVLNYFVLKFLFLKTYFLWTAVNEQNEHVCHVLIEFFRMNLELSWIGSFWITKDFP